MDEKKPLLCPKCGQPLKVIYRTHIFATKSCDVYENGVELLSDEELKKIKSGAELMPPTMFVNDLCFVAGYYGNVEPSGFFHNIGNVICPNCGILVNYEVKKDEHGVYNLISNSKKHK